MALSIEKNSRRIFFAVTLFSLGSYYGVSQQSNLSQNDAQSIMLLNVGVVILVLLVGLFLAWHITTRLKVILNGLKAFNSGLLNHQINSDSDDELGRTLGVKNEQDQLSSSLNQLVDTLDDTAQQATFIASGNYEVDNKLPHSKLRAMTGFLALRFWLLLHSTSYVHIFEVKPKHLHPL